MKLRGAFVIVVLASILALIGAADSANTKKALKKSLCDADNPPSYCKSANDK
jgi:hypothetical protein